jgi:hypothetical protein
LQISKIEKNATDMANRIGGQLQWSLLVRSTQCKQDLGHEERTLHMSWRHELSVLKDTIAYVMAGAPGSFPYREYLPSDQQMNLDRAFDQVREQFDKVSKSCGDTPEMDECRKGIENAYQCYREGDTKAGLLKIQDVLHLLMRI